MPPNILEDERIKYFARMSQSRKLRRRMAKELGLMKYGWQNIKDQFPPRNQPMDLGIKKFKKAGHSNKDVLEFKKKSYGALSK